MQRQKHRCERKLPVSHRLTVSICLDTSLNSKASWIKLNRPIARLSSWMPRGVLQKLDLELFMERKGSTSSVLRFWKEYMTTSVAIQKRCFICVAPTWKSEKQTGLLKPQRWLKD